MRVISATILGIGLGAFLDRIVLHQIAQWHNMGSAIVPPVTMDAMRRNRMGIGTVASPHERHRPAPIDALNRGAESPSYETILLCHTRMRSAALPFTRSWSRSRRTNQTPR